MHLFILSVACVLLLLGFPCILTEVVDSFHTCSNFFLNGQPPVIPGVLDNSVSQDNNRYKLICQKYKGAYRFASLYDTTNKIPVFSAYKYTERKNNNNFTKRKDQRWKIEPQLNFVDEMTVPFANQAINVDYKNCTILYRVNRGHLFPFFHAADPGTANSTFTLTNIVPQYVTFNNGSWNRMEHETKNIMNTCRNEKNEVLAHVLTGAIPSNITMNDKVNIPSDMWMAFCCYNSTENGSVSVSKAYWAKNEEENQTNITISSKSLQELQDFFNTTWVQNVQLFENNCKQIWKNYD